MFRLLYLAFLVEPRGEAADHHHATPISMLIPLVILALLSVSGGWISWSWTGVGRFGEFLVPVLGGSIAEAGGDSFELILSAVAVVVAVLGWFVAELLYHQKPEGPAKLAGALPGAHKLLANKYYVDELYGATVVKPLMAISTYLLGWLVDKAILGGAAWLLGGIATFAGALLQRWQSGNLRSYAAWLAAGAGAVLLFVVVDWSWVVSNFGIHFTMAGQ
jgi:NADH-quinone oxidoreductase subunit L